MWKKKEDGNLEIDTNGNPIWVDEINNSEKGVDYKETRKQISELTEKAHNRKESYDKLVGVLNENNIAIEELPEFINNAKSNKEKLDNLGKGGKNDSLQPLKDEIDELKKVIQKEKLEKQELVEKQNNEKINTMFLENAYLKEKTNPVIVRDIFKKNFKYEDGKLVGYLDGKKIKNDEMEDADFDTCIKTMIDSYPAKDMLLVGNINGGAGSKGSNAGGEDYSKLSFSELFYKIDNTTDPVLKKQLKEMLNKK